MSVRSVLGMDWFDFALQVVITGVILVWIKETNSGQDANVGIAVATTTSLVLLGIRRHFGLRKLAAHGLTTGEVALATLSELEQRVAELDQRLAELEAAQARVAELEERLDFTERLLASRDVALALRPGGEASIDTRQG